MSLASANSEREKFDYLLQLAQEQIKALEADDMYGFDRILAARKTIIDSLVDAPGQLAADSTLQSVVTNIQDCDKSAQRLLYRKVGRIMRAMSELHQAKKARRAYFNASAGLPSLLSQFQSEPARFMDQKS